MTVFPNVVAASVVVMLLLGINAEIPDNYIMQVKPTCGTTSSPATINIITDLHVTATAECAGSSKQDFNASNSVKLWLDVGYTAAQSLPCVFNKRESAEVYTVKVYVHWGEKGSPIQQHEEIFQVTCTHEDTLSKKTSSQAVGKGLVAPKEIQSHEGSASSDTVTFTVCDVLGNAITDPYLTSGRWVQLIADLSATKGFHPDGCDVIATTAGAPIHYAILRAGCGDGLVFKKDQGFTTTSGTSSSPYFEMIDLPGSTGISFKCNFTVCSALCNGNSCTNARKKRQISEPQGYVMASTATFKNIQPRELFEDLDDNRDVHGMVVNFWVVVCVLSGLSVLACVLALASCYRLKRVQHVVS